MKRLVLTLALAVPLLLAAAGCHGWFVLDGYDAAYVDVPADYARHPRYSYRGAAVYEVDGRYYRQHGDRWVVYRDRPRELQREGEERGRGEGERR